MRSHCSFSVFLVVVVSFVVFFKVLVVVVVVLVVVVGGLVGFVVYQNGFFEASCDAFVGTIFDRLVANLHFSHFRD